MKTNNGRLMTDETKIAEVSDAIRYLRKKVSVHSSNRRAKRPDSRRVMGVPRLVESVCRSLSLR